MNPWSRWRQVIGAAAFWRSDAEAGALPAWRLTLAMALAGCVALLLIMVSELGYREAQSQLQRLVTMGQIRLSLTQVARRVTDAESGQRGYLLTNRADYLEPYRNASRDTREGLARLRQLYAELGAPVEEEHRQRLDELVQAKLSELAEVMSLHDQGRVDAAQALLATGIGRDQMQLIRQEVDALLDLQNRHISRGLSQVFNTLQLNRLAVTALTLLILLALALYLRQARALNAERVAKQRLIQIERDRLEDEVRKRTRELTELARHLETAREDERARLARDLHDELGALLTTAKLDVARLRPSLLRSHPELDERIKHLNEMLNSGIALKRRIIEDLRPSTLDNLGLLPALQTLCEEFSERVGVPVHTALQAQDLSRSAQLTVFRMVQESLTNIAKYAQAEQVQVALDSPQPGWARICVQDDGQGFDPSQLPLARHGLLGMRYRIEAEGGELLITASPGHGSTLQARLPLQSAAA